MFFDLVGVFLHFLVIMVAVKYIGSGHLTNIPWTDPKSWSKDQWVSVSLAALGIICALSLCSFLIELRGAG